jgi:DNA-binding MarR family transcriptional regulator
MLNFLVLCSLCPLWYLNKENKGNYDSHIKKERIFRVLSTQEDLTITKISEQTRLAKSYVSKVVSELKKKGIVFGAEKIHVNYDKLIREWEF